MYLNPKANRDDRTACVDPALLAEIKTIKAEHEAELAQLAELAAAELEPNEPIDFEDVQDVWSLEQICNGSLDDLFAKIQGTARAVADPAMKTRLRLIALNLDDLADDARQLLRQTAMEARLANDFVPYPQTRTPGATR